MKKILLSLPFIFILLACSDNDVHLTEDTNKEIIIINEYQTKKDLSVSFSIVNLRTLSEEPFNALGYGYDITGKYAHPAWIKQKVIDPQKYEDDHYYRVMRDKKLFYHRGLGTLTGTKSQIKEKLLVSSIDETATYKNVFKGVFDLPFESDTTYINIKYYYAIDAFASSWYAYYFNDTEEDLISQYYNYLTNDFKSDIQKKSAKDIINTYGTHVLMSIETGVRQDYYFRASSDNELERRMVYNSAKYFYSTPGIMMSRAPEEYMDKENIYTEYIGGIHTYPNAWMADITNYDNKLKVDLKVETPEKKDIVLINFLNNREERAIIPIYEFIEDSNKRELIKQAYINYLNF